MTGPSTTAAESTLDPAQVEAAAEAIRESEALLITAGAGMGVDSGLPDFRGDRGFWRAYPAYEALGLRFSDLANPGWFHRDPTLAWGFYGHRLSLYRKTEPHAGFAILKRWAERMARGAYVFTSNVDGQFQRAGFADDRVVEVHGGIGYLQCLALCRPRIFSAPPPPPGRSELVEVDPQTFRAVGPLPSCPDCGGLARPNILMFNDGEWLTDRYAQRSDRMRAWLARLPQRGLVIVELGAGLSIPTVRLFGEQVMYLRDAFLARINPREPEIPSDGRAACLAGGARVTLTAIDAVIERLRGPR
jgi:NAD-dependent SIR2 family protein deacetylase